MIIEDIKEVLNENKEIPDIFKRNIVKEFLQVVVLSHMYNQKEYKNLIFYGGSALRHCYGLNRLSEDLDFVNTGANIDFEKAAKGLAVFFDKKYSLKIDTKIQKFRILLKFPILKELGMSKHSESKTLYLKIEIFEKFNFCKKYNVEKIPVFKFGEAVIVNTFDLPTLMATKIRAVLNRKWEKISKTGEILAVVKGRDYYDLMWYFQKGINPNLDCIESIGDKKELKDKLKTAILKIDSKSIKYDLDALISDRDFVNNVSGSIKGILFKYIEVQLQ